MRIDRIETIPVSARIRPERAIRSRAGFHDLSPFRFVKVITTSGLVGIGEVSATLAWSGEDHITAQHVIDALLAPLLIGRDPLEIQTIVSDMDFAVPGHLFTKAGLEMALWDVAGKAAGKPVYELLGGKVRDRIRTKFSISAGTPHEAANLALWAVDQGFSAMKVKVGRNSIEDIDRVKAVREAVGPSVLLGVDANGGWSVEQAIAALNRLEPCSLAFAEQPVARDDPRDMAEVRKSIPQKVMADESAFDLIDVYRLGELAAADCVSIYVGKGGLLKAMRMAEAAASYGMACTIGSNLELGIAAAAQIHLGVACSAIMDDQYPCDILTPFYYDEDYVTEDLPIHGGFADKPAGIGLGVELAI